MKIFWFPVYFEISAIMFHLSVQHLLERHS